MDSQGCGALVFHVGQVAADIHADDVAKATGKRPDVWECDCGYWHTGEKHTDEDRQRRRIDTYLLGFLLRFQNRFSPGQLAEVYEALSGLLSDTRTERALERAEWANHVVTLHKRLTAEVQRRQALEEQLAITNGGYESCHC